MFFDCAMIFLSVNIVFFFFVDDAAKHLFEQFEKIIKQFAKANLDKRV